MPIARRGLAKNLTDHPRGQSLVELALIVPLLLFMALATFDFARVFIAGITVEAAARDAADYGSFYPYYWSATNTATTVERMEARACSAASTLTDYDGDPPSDIATCSNPAFSYQLIKPSGVSDCSTVPRTSPPCWVEVSLQFEFHPIIPLHLRFGDTELGIPSQVTISRTRTFAVADFAIDASPVPSP